VIGDDLLSIHSRTLLIRYPEMLLFNQLKTNATVSEEDDNSSNSSSSSKLMIDESVDKNCEEVSIEIFDISKKYFYFFVDGCIRDGLYAR
jgi:hypothetical protein